MARIEIDGREFELLYDMGAMELGYAEFGSMEELNAAIRHEKGRNMISDMLRLMAVMANNYLESIGEKPDVTVSWLRHHMPMMRTAEYAKALNETIAEGVQRELVQQKKGPVDGWLEEEKKA